jgi:glycosyltransferase involved in cell wall biosynthesis
MPSSGEGFGIVLLEAAASGIPVIGSKADGSREALLNGRMGRLVNPKEKSEITEAISEVLNNNAPRRRPEGTETFGVDHFRARVDLWAREQFKGCVSKHDAA